MRKHVHFLEKLVSFPNFLFEGGLLEKSHIWSGMVIDLTGE